MKFLVKIASVKEVNTTRQVQISFQQKTPSKFTSTEKIFSKRKTAQSWTNRDVEMSSKCFNIIKFEGPIKFTKDEAPGH